MAAKLQGIVGFSALKKLSTADNKCQQQDPLNGVLAASVDKEKVQCFFCERCMGGAGPEPVSAVVTGTMLNMAILCLCLQVNLGKPPFLKHKPGLS